MGSKKNINLHNTCDLVIYLAGMSSKIYITLDYISLVMLHNLISIINPPPIIYFIYLFSIYSTLITEKIHIKLNIQ